MTERNGRCGFIDDGYTIEAVIPEGETYPEVKITYRPVTTRIYRTMMFQNLESLEKGTKGVQNSEKLADELLVRHIEKWDLKDQNGGDVEVNEENMSRLNRHLSGKLFILVMGIKEEPEPESSEKNSVAG